MASDTASESSPLTRTRLERLRHERGLSRERLAVAAGVCVSTVARAELRYRVPNRSSLLLLARELGAEDDDPYALLNDASPTGGPGSVNDPAVGRPNHEAA